MRVLYITLLLLFVSHSTSLADTTAELSHGYFTVYNEQHEVILQTSLEAQRGDQFISDTNQLYEITQITGYLAQARFVETITLPQQPLAAAASKLSAQTPSLIAIYHTHTDESYIPSDGKATIPANGGIFKVGDIFAAKLQELGYVVDHNTTSHEPHNASAYDRSRRTVFQLLQNNPAALFDIHRDSTPANIYQAVVDNQDVARVMIVVGRSNPAMTTSYEYAKQLKAASDQLHPRLVRGIFIAHGNYNQDLSPRDILLEVGTQDNSRDEAERGIALFADAIPAIISTTSGQPIPPADPIPDHGSVSATAQSQAGIRNILLIVAALIAGVFAYLYISTGSFREMKSKLRQLKDTEFMHFMGRLKRRWPRNRR